MAALPLLLAAAAGFYDALWNGDGLRPSEALLVYLLWQAFALPVAAAGGLAGFVLQRLLANRLRTSLVLEITSLIMLQTALFAGGIGGFLEAKFAIISSAGALVAIPLITRRALDPAGWVRRLPLTLLAMGAACLLLPFLRGVVPRSLTALACYGSVAAILALWPASRVQHRAASLGMIALGGWAAIHLGLDAREVPTSGSEASKPALPNVVLIVLDTQRADHLGAYGSPAGLTPNIDHLASQATLYERCYATAGWTVPTHASLFTGLYPQSHGSSFEHHRHLDDRFQTLAEALKARGYDTAGFAANDYISLANLDQGLDHFEGMGEPFKTLALRRLLQLVGFPSRFMDHGIADGIDRVARYLDTRAEPERPLFLFINLLEPHWRHFPPLAERLAELPAGVGLLQATLESTRFYGPPAMAEGPGSAKRDLAIQGLYAAAVRYQDRELARLLALLDSQLPTEDTLLIVTNDHGENLGEAGRWDHVFAINDYLVHAPLLIRHPAFPAGQREAGLCSHIDIPATIADVVGSLDLDMAPDARTLVPDRFDGRRFVFAAGDPYIGHLERMAGAAGLERDAAQWNKRLRSVRDDRFKYVESSLGESRLYDPAQDPDESHDVAASHPHRVAELRDALHSWNDRVSTYQSGVSERGERGLSDEELERLKSLGYVQ